jgi:hypothetical protein
VDYGTIGVIRPSGRSIGKILGAARKQGIIETAVRSSRAYASGYDLERNVRFRKLFSKNSLSKKQFAGNGLFIGFSRGFFKTHHPLDCSLLYRTVPVLVSRHLAISDAFQSRRYQILYRQGTTFTKGECQSFLFLLAILESTMGRTGTAHKHRATRKTTCEDSLGFGITDLPELIPGVNGVLTWTKEGAEIASAGYRSRGVAPYLVLSLHFQHNGHYIHIPLRLQST